MKSWNLVTEMNLREREREREWERDARASSKEQFFWGQRSACVLSFRSHLYLKKHTNRFNAWKYDMSTMVLFLVMIFGTRSTKSWKICPRNFRSWNPPPNWSHFVTRFCVIMGPNVTCAAGFGDTYGWLFPQVWIPLVLDHAQEPQLLLSLKENLISWM